MGARGSLALLFVAIGLGLVLWLSDDAPPGGDPILTDPVLDGRSVVDAARIVVHAQADLLGVEFERGADAVWRVVEPVRDVASMAVLESFRVAYDTAQLVVAYEPEQVDARLLAETGLDAPRASIRFEWPAEAIVELELGLPGPYGDDLFARRAEPGASRRIYRVQRALLNALQITPTDARDRQAFRTEPAQARKVQVIRRGLARDGGDDSISLVRSGTGWELVEPVRVRIDQGQTQGFVRALLGLRIDEFLPGKPAGAVGPVGPDAPPDVSILIDGGASREQVDLYFVGEREALVGVNDLRGVWFSCDVRGYDQVVEVPIRALRARWLFSSSVADMSSIRLTPPGGTTLELERRPAGGFRLARPIRFGADPTAVAELLQGLRSVAVVEFVAEDVTDFESYGLGARALALEVEEPRRRPERVLVGADTGEASTWLRRADEAHVVTVPREAAARLRRPWWIYVDRQVLKIEDGARVRRMVRSLPDGSAIEFARGDDGGWRRGGGASDPPLLVGDTFDLLRDLRAVEVLPDAAFGPPGAPPGDEGSLDLIADTGQVVASLRLARAADGRGMCAIADAPGVQFVLTARDTRDVLGLR